MKKENKEEMIQLEKVKNITAKNLNIMLKKDMVYHHLDKLIEVIQWDCHHNHEKNNIIKFQLEVLTVTRKKLLD